MAKRKFSINVFDVLVVIAIILCAVFCFIGLNNKPNLGQKTLEVTVKITDSKTIKNILPKLYQASDVYFSGTKYSVKQSSYSVNDQKTELFIRIQGPGDINTGKSIFNGQKIFVNRKVEIRADYWAQGYVTDFYYVD